MTSHLFVGANIELGDVNVLDKCGIFLDGSRDIVHRRSVDVVVTLHSDTVDRYAGVLHFLHHIIDALALSLVGCIVVII